MGAIDKEKYTVVPIGITKEGRWLASGDPWQALSSGVVTGSTPAALLAEPTQRGLMCLEEGEEENRLTAVRLSRIDVLFPVLHGPYGEDGTIQGLLELADVPYVGAGVLGSAMGMDKAVMKDMFRSRNLPIVPSEVVWEPEADRDPRGVIRRIQSRLKPPLFVKPANLGSSVGITKVKAWKGLAPALKTAFLYDRKIVVEQGVDCREFECAVLGNDDPQASVLGEILPANEFYDYDDKYLLNKTGFVLPADVPAAISGRARRLAVEAFRACEASGMARVDFFMEKKTGRLLLNEINTIPGFTAISMYPKLWAASGIPFPELVDRLIVLALERHRLKKRRVLRDPGA
jgi:D-alanine-D-alanine ligase